MNTTLQAELAQWDTKSITHISRIYITHYEDPSFIDELIAMMPETTLEVGATWLFKHALDEGDLVGLSLERSQLNDIYNTLNALSHWGAQLHLLQCLPHLPIPKDSVSKVESFVRLCLISETKFVRAWAYTGLHTLATQYPTYRGETESLMDDAIESNEPASVKARVRQLIKQGFRDNQ